MDNIQNQESNHIDIQVIQGALSLIDAAIKRGTYHPSEISSVGSIRDKLDGAVSTYVEANGQDNTNNQSSEKVS